jgi:hypothetical protein
MRNTDDEQRSPFEHAAAVRENLAGSAFPAVALVEYLRQARSVWTETLQDARNAVEHEGWTLPGVRYARTASRIKAIEPEIRGKRAAEFATFIFDRLACLVEAVTTHLLQRKLPALTGLAEFGLAA